MTTVASSVVFDDIFTIESIDKEGKKFDRGISHSFQYLRAQCTRLQFRDSMDTLKTMTWT